MMRLTPVHGRLGGGPEDYASPFTRPMAFATTSLASDSDSPLPRGFFDGTTPTRLGQIEPAPEHEGDHAHDDSGSDRSIEPFQRSADIVNLLIQRRKAGVHVVELLTSLGVLDVAHPLTSFQIANALEDRSVLVFE